MRKVCFITGSRAEYGLLRLLMKEIRQDKDLHLQVIATGSHLSAEFGYTYREIEADGFQVDEKIEILFSSDSSSVACKSIGAGLFGLAQTFSRLQPDIVVLLGDRLEILSAATAAMIFNIPIAHIHGGESTEGAFDDYIRHSITKMSYLHFVSAETYRKRVVQLGEDNSRVFNFGALCLDQIKNNEYITVPELEKRMDFCLNPPIFLITFHPETLSNVSPKQSMLEILKALDFFPEARLVFTYSNADPGGRAIIKTIDDYVLSRPCSAKAFKSLGIQNYLSLMKVCNLVIGNSSSGIIEAPQFRKAVVNIGNRQEGRLKASSILDVECDSIAIRNAIIEAMSDAFQSKLSKTVSLYGAGGASVKITQVLKTFPLSNKKRFFDIAHDY